MLIQASEIIEKITHGRGTLVVAPNRRHPEFPSMTSLPLRAQVVGITLQGLESTVLLLNESPDMSTLDKWEQHYPLIARQITKNGNPELGRVIGYEHYREYPELQALPTICGIRSADLYNLPATLRRIKEDFDAVEPGMLTVTIPPCIEYSGTHTRKLARAAVNGSRQSLAKLATMVHPGALPLILEATKRELKAAR